MAGIVWEITWKGALAFMFLTVAGGVVPALLQLGETEFQTKVVLSFFVYCCLALFSFSKARLFHVISIPVFSQFLQLFERYSFPAGANSPWRLLPFLILDIYFFNFFLRKQTSLSNDEKLFVASWIVSGFTFLIFSANAERICYGVIVLSLVTLPCYFVYLRFCLQAPDFAASMEEYLCLLFVILGFGTMGLVVAGAAYTGSENLLATRNITDTNVTMAYFILLWPFSLLYINRQQSWKYIKIVLLSLLFTAVVIFSFSRGAVFLIAPYLLFSLWFAGYRKVVLLFLFVPLVAFTCLSKFSDFAGFQDLSYFWKLRFGEVSNQSLIQKLSVVSGRDEIHAIAYRLFLQSPWLGHGTGSFEVLGPGYREAHSLWFTLLAESGAAGTIMMYAIFGKCFVSMLRAAAIGKRYVVVVFGFVFYLIFNHTVGSVFLIVPAKSVTVNCLAPVLLLCQYFYVKCIVNQQHA